MASEDEAQHAARLEEEEILLAMSAPSSRIADYHFALAAKFRRMKERAAKQFAVSPTQAGN